MVVSMYLIKQFESMNFDFDIQTFKFRKDIVTTTIGKFIIYIRVLFWITVFH